MIGRRIRIAVSAADTGVMTEVVGQVLELFFTGSARVRQGVNFTLALTPTTLGRPLLHSTHGAVGVRVVLTSD